MSFEVSLPKINLKQGFINFWPKAKGSSQALVLAQLANTLKQPLIIICNTQSQLARLERELNVFLNHKENPTNIPVISFPDWETLPYDYFSAHETIISDRLSALSKLPQLKQGIVLTALNSIMMRLAPPSFIKGHVFKIKTGDRLDLQAARHQFEQAGYRCVDRVLEHGEFAIRGSLLDLFPMGTNEPIRIDFFDDEVESIRLFDPETQLSDQTIEFFSLLPAHEFPSTEQGITQFRQNFRQAFDIDLKDCSIYQDVSKGLLPAGIEYYLPLFFESTATLFDYFPENSVVFYQESLSEQFTKQFDDLSERYEQHRWDRTRPILAPEKIALEQNELNALLKSCFRIIENSNEAKESFEIQSIPELTVNHKAKDPLAALRKFHLSKKKPIIICVESAGRREAVSELLQRHKLTFKQIESWHTEKLNTETLFVCIAPIDNGFELPTVVFLAESEIFGQHVIQQRRKSKRTISPDAAIHSLAELKLGDPVVHVEHGVGRYLGLQVIEANKQSAEYLTLQYSGGDKLYVPVQALHLIHRYAGASELTAPLHKLGTEQWAKERKKAAEKIRDVAAELLDLYAKREAKPGFQYDLAKNDYITFSEEFAFELTDDQDNAIKSIFADMTSKNPMDRLVCGDVGFGKTEVAMRAAFLAVQNNKQVAILVPTTLLAQQHFENFKDRFANWPIKIDWLSRFRTASETKQTAAEIESGKVDIVIGTHKLIQGDIKFKDLGLVIIDEEHRFGVRQKEKLKSLRSEVDILTLTATPIPRTLNMSLSGMRDLSIIATPPAKRLSIKTFVREANKPLVKEAIQREALRGGQVYLLHNSVETIERRAEEIRELMPELNIAVAHGQMRERELEQVMQQFYHHRYHVLVCTTIIETGIDVPNANTIIMDRADRLGLAQLHQLRGRVGRSHHQAYAYLLTPSPKALTSDAKKRLTAISELEDLGAGFSLATHDMEIRGAGEILGEEQSGQMTSIGFSLYMEMLEKAIENLKSGKQQSLTDTLSQQTEIEFGIPALIPEDYLPDVHTRLVLYKRIASAKTDDNLRDIQVEMIDRFGLLPDPTKTLFKLTSTKLALSPLGITKVIAGDQGLAVEFDPNTVVNPQLIINMIQSNPSRYRLERGTVLKINKSMPDESDRWHQIESLIATLGGSR